MGKIWNFLWKSNNPLSWIIDILIIFLIVKFIIFPVAGATFGTSMPFVIVESGSMHHEGSFDVWWQTHKAWYLDNNIPKDEIQQYWPFLNGFNKGDIVIVKGSKEYKKGQVIIFKDPSKPTPIIHRIVLIEQKGNETIYSTKGDHNDGQLFPPYYPVDERNILKDQIIGKAVSRIPYLGWIKLIFVKSSG